MIKALIGNGGHAREVMAQMGIKLFRFVDDQYMDNDTLPLSELDIEKYEVMVAIADSRDRYDTIQRLPKGIKFFKFIHPTALIMDNVEIGEGSFIGAYSILTTNIKIGKHAILNRGNQIGHDTIIGDFFSAMPGSIVSGNVRIHNYVYLGTNSSIREKLTIIDDVTIGLNTGIVKSINKSGTNVPISMFGLQKDSIVSRYWFTGIDSTKTFSIPRNGEDRLVLNYDQKIPEFNQRDNWKSLKGFLSSNKKLKFQFFKDTEDPFYNQIFYVPTLRFNIYDVHTARNVA